MKRKKTIFNRKKFFNKKNESGQYVKSTLLILACASGKFNIIDVLIENGVDVNQEIQGGNTPLHAAAEMNQIVALQSLLKAKNIKINAQNLGG